MSGVFPHMPAAEYHAAEALSAGGAWTLASECPALYHHRSPFNPDAARAENGKRMDIGTALHLAALVPARLAERTVLVDADDWRTKDARERRDAAYELGAVPLLTKDAELVGRLADALRGNRHAAELLTDAQTEVSYFWQHEGIPCKARADIISRDRKTIGDLKASASASPQFFQKQAFNAGHFLRSVWYSGGWREITGHYPTYWYIIVSREEPHIVTVARLDERATAWGEQMIRRALVLFKECRKIGVWPPYCTEPQILSLPGWSEYHLADAEQDGRFDPELIRRGMELLVT